MVHFSVLFHPFPGSPYITFSTLQVSLVLSALQAGNKGTQACITAATAVSGIIADLDTTIMFATAGTLNAENGETFADHRYWGRLEPAYLNRDHIWSPCPGLRNVGIYSDINKILCGECKPQNKIRISSFSNKGLLSGSCPFDCPQTQQDQERQGQP